jgi:hypothetical protein
MAKLFGELLFYVIRVVVYDLISAAVLKSFAWLAMQVPRRWPRFIALFILGVVAYFAVPIIMALLGL